MCPMTATPLTIEWSLLGFLRQEPMHGYQIYQRLSKSQGMGLVWHLKQSQLYALLTKLERREYVTYAIERQEGRPDRKVYELTAAGRAALLAWVRTPVARGREFRMEFLAKLYFARQEGERILAELLSEQRTACRGWLAELETEAAECCDEYTCLVYQFRIGQMEAVLAWIDLCEQMLLKHSSR